MHPVSETLFYLKKRNSFCKCIASEVTFTNTVAPKVCSVDPKGSATSSQGIGRYIFVMAALKFDILLKIMEELISLAMGLFRMTAKISN
jgi:hypothetical protein